ncbi:hypothetical protein ASPACDRAFT_111448 [Aspergillus aculeatus ATCC 16872]|uniref:Glucose-methanol-choline oxidoreductase C-terminal domain-containing protein n=1 Tax=Aspergillus aculeatus (strain ATCC 16872 / CBS 172.66 / WB 5094) TaxID=690307 RepID=A0A1L9X572_ASPA1|nr:uncharacterized protein ASPACDRAFT_111448 [Aspergillus aculeatus ATCC 16872]OJK03597.1 hypothetical protein ASPACDRAFT_111448 [Aspergillus aculeatus ATCC 16872]
MSPAHPGNFITLVSTLCYPLSRGSVHIRSANPRDHPALDHGILRHPFDLELHARHALWMEKLAATPSRAAVLKQNGVRLHSPKPLTDLGQAKEVTKELLLSTFHLAGTCAMMPREDGGVVDLHLRVYVPRTFVSSMPESSRWCRAGISRRLCLPSRRKLCSLD